MRGECGVLDGAFCGSKNMPVFKVYFRGGKGEMKGAVPS
jgi:hypothetical protein